MARSHDDGRKRRESHVPVETAEDSRRPAEAKRTLHQYHEVSRRNQRHGSGCAGSRGCCRREDGFENWAPRYTEALEDYRKHLKKDDPAITGAITDVKGNRSLRPSAQEQHQDFYVRVVDRQKDGIIVRGAKMHISDTPGANEIIVSPCRAHREEDKDYAVVFATPLNAPGLKLFTSPRFFPETGDEARWNWPLSGAAGGISECMIVFDDVFVPWNRVFMCGEWQFSRDIAWTFGVFHRLFGTCHKVIFTEEAAGAAALIAEYNGIDKYPHIQEKLAWLAMHAEIVSAMSRAGCEHPDIFCRHWTRGTQPGFHQYSQVHVCQRPV